MSVNAPDLSNEIRIDLLTRRLEAAKNALRAIAQGPADDITPENWGEWCTVWARDELNHLDTIKARQP